MCKAKRVLIISTKVGAGHIRAAEALEAAFHERHGDVEVKTVEALSFTNAAFRRSYTGTYNLLASELPSVWEYLYEKMEDKSPDSKAKKFSSLVHRLNSKAMKRAVLDFEPDAVVCTHWLPAEVLSPLRLTGKLPARLSVVLTDYDIHTMWVHEGVDKYFVATEAMAYALRAKGVGGAEVNVTGIPVMPVFSRGFPAKDEMRRKLGVKTGVPTVLVVAGGFGLANVEGAVTHMAEAASDAQFLAVAGRNEELLATLEEIAAERPGTVVPYGFVTNMEELMAASDFAVTKSGGLTSSECLVMGLPMVIWNPIPGQEERNADYLLENGAGLRANSPAHLVFKVKRLVADGELLGRMSAAARAIARPGAAFQIAREILEVE